ncbi:MAG: VCBS repeat-containing protein [Gomphosphaeria aponina SAG 52.96 = DSM 107014]|uniref:VCBS repeat-containing protein n=1 Tax=Gomphosphaeria aponina SAG 52.96 = DSM 107014 TaxID=1521640 RepID=A0A941GQ98_9CHRO|nr:VCBS repeat-containing protein [Gomphosphaeria aponina SAG 52.96 = DSM 107014]
MTTYFPVSDELLFSSTASVETADLAVGANNEAIAVGLISGVNDVLVQRFNADGTTNGEGVILALEPEAGPPVVDIADDGSFAVAYAVTKEETIGEGESQVTVTHRDIVIRTFDATASELGSPITVGSTNDEYDPDIQIDNNGNVALVGVQEVINEDGSSNPGEIWLTAFDSNGNEIVPLEFLTETESVALDPQIALRKSGVSSPNDISAVVSFTLAEELENGVVEKVLLQPYEGNLGEFFQPIGSNIGISAIVRNSFLQEQSSVAINEAGEYIVTWTDNTSGVGNISGLLVKEESIFRDNLTQTAGVAESNSSVGIASDGSFVVAYENNTEGAVEYLEFGEDGERLGEPQVVNGLQSEPSLGILPSGEGLAIAGVTNEGTLGVQGFRELAPPGVDFNNDGNSDILWRNRATGENGIWIMNGVELVQPVTLESQDNTAWTMQGTGDFNDDGFADLFWRNMETGANGFWFMGGEDGTELVETVESEAQDNTAWYAGGVADFNGDGEEDLLWRNQETGANGIWLMDGTERVETVELLGQDNTNWDIYGTGDFNGDGQVDILWRDDEVTGANGVWLMNGTEVMESVEIESQTNTAWYMGGTGDFNSDGQVDILWRNSQTGANGLWIMNGLERETNVVLESQLNNDWRMIPAG